MESSSAGPVAASALPLSAYTHTHTPIRGTFHGVKLETFDQSSDPFIDESTDIKLEHDNNPQPLPGSLDTPMHIPFLNHFQASNVRGSIGDLPLIHHASGNDDPEFGSELVANESSIYGGDSDMQSVHNQQSVFAQYNAQLDTLTLDDPFTEDGTQTQTQFTEEEEENPKPMQAYAKLCLPDGDYFVTSPQVIVGRDMDYWRQYVREKKRAERAQQALDEYALEPSQPSQHDDGELNRGPSSKSSQSLVGRPAKALPSNYSEQGGAVYYPAISDDEESNRRARKKRKNMKSSASSTSIAPAILHPNPNMSAELGVPTSHDTDSGAAEDSSIPQMVYIHPANRDDIRVISKEHLLFDYNAEEEKWELTILGNRAFVNNDLHQRNARVPLSHGDEIIVTSVSIYFKLPEIRASPNRSRGTFADSDAADDLDPEDLDSDADASPSRHQPDDSSSGLSDEDDEDDDEVEGGGRASDKKLKLKLNFKRKLTGDPSNPNSNSRGAKQSGKGPRKLSNETSSIEQSPEAARKSGKSKQPKESVDTLAEDPEIPAQAFSLQSAEGVDLTKIHEALRDDEVSPAMPPPPPPVIEPGSIFEGVAAEELPQKRKGPGRPPKNGLISKRDQSFVKRKLKEYEKRGQAPPPMDELVKAIRIENKAKELAAKAAARGEAPPDMSVMPSIELDPCLASTPRTDGVAVDATGGETSATPAEPVKKPSPKPKRVVKTPSPMKPESEYTEEELKKPTVTYVHILDEVLRDHPTGKADLQEIYDRICKRYPHFKYRVNTAGWQSSVRHNLLQHDRFVENGRSGKGRLWTINYDCPIDKEKKRRVSPPPRPPIAAMQNGNFGPQFGQSGYNTSYVQPGGQQAFHPVPQQGSSAYYSPYAPQQHGQPSAFNQGRPPNGLGPSQQGVTGHLQHPLHPQQPNSGQALPPSQQPPQNPPQFQGMVDEIMQYRSQYLSRFQPNSDSFKEHDELFRNCTMFISNVFHGTSTSVEGALKTEEERKVYVDLEKISTKYQHLRGPPATTPSAEGKDSSTPRPASQGAGPGQNANSSTSGQFAAATPSQPSVNNTTVNAPATNISQTQSLATNVQGSATSVQRTESGQYTPQTSVSQPSSTPGVGASQTGASSENMSQNHHPSQGQGTISGNETVPTPSLVSQSMPPQTTDNSSNLPNHNTKLGLTNGAADSTTPTQIGGQPIVSSSYHSTSDLLPTSSDSDQSQGNFYAAPRHLSDTQNSTTTLNGHSGSNLAEIRHNQESHDGKPTQAQQIRQTSASVPGMSRNMNAIQHPPISSQSMISGPQLNGVLTTKTAFSNDRVVAQLPVNSAEQPIIISDNPEADSTDDSKPVKLENNKTPAGVKRPADDSTMIDDNDTKKVKTNI